MNIIGESPAAPAGPGGCNGPSLTGIERMIHDGAAALIEILLVLQHATHTGEDVSLTALSAVHDVCDAVTVGWMMAKAQTQSERVTVEIGL